MYNIKFEELTKFLKDLITNDGLKGIFLKKTCASIKDDTLELLSRNLNWQFLMRELQILDNPEPKYAKKLQASGHKKRIFYNSC